MTVLEPREITTDVLIIGAEGAGARAAIEARRHGVDVLAVSKLYVARSGSTICAPGDYSCDSRSLIELGMPGDPHDSPESFYEDTLKGGREINNPCLLRLLVERAPARLKDLIDFGARFTKTFHYGGHRYPRGAAVGRVGKTGVTVMQVLSRECRRLGAGFYQGCMILDLLSRDGHVCGAVGIDVPSGDMVVFHAKAVILATGGNSRIWKFTSNPEEITGDGIVMAYRAGAALCDLEMSQFIPYAQAWPTAMAGNIHFAYEVVSLLDSHLHNSLGERFMVKYDPERLEKSTRDHLSIGIASEVAAGRGSVHGGAYVSTAHLRQEDVDAFAAEMFPKWQVGAFSLSKFGFDPTVRPIEIAPAAHYTVGGVLINERCETTLPGLYAAGEVAANVHGANRLSGNALTETQVFGAIAGEQAARFAQRAAPRPDTKAAATIYREALRLIERDSMTTVFDIRRALHQLSETKVGVLRSGQGLEEAVAETGELCRLMREEVGLRLKDRRANQEWMRAIEIANMLEGLKITAQSALMRTESRGAHYRLDHPEAGADLYHTVVARRDGRETLQREPVGTVRHVEEDC